MESFTFGLPTEIVFGEGVIKEAGKRAKALGAKKVMLVADKGVISAGLTKPVEEGLQEEHIPYVVFDQVVPNPRDFHCEEGYRAAKAAGVDFLIAVGGGSSMDTAKTIGTLLTHGKTVQDWCGFHLLEREITPLIAIPTTAGTGSEVTPFAVVTDSQTHVKLNIFDPRAAAKVALIDPTVLLHLPSHIMAATGIDAMTHAVESYTCKVANPLTDACAIYAVQMISKNLRNAVHHHDLEACTGMLVGSMIAGIAFGYADVAAVHCMAEALGGRYDTPHGVANAVLLPTVTEFNIPSNPKKYADIAKALGVADNGQSELELAMAGAEELRKLCHDVGIGTLKETKGVDPADFPALAAAAMQNVSASSNPREMTEADFLALYKKAYECA